MMTSLFMKRFCPMLLLSLVLAACSYQRPVVIRDSRLPPVTVANGNEAVVPVPTYRLMPRHWTDVAKIRAEAQRLALQVADKQITKVQAAQYLNKYRLGLVGSNPVDDNIYDVYQSAAVDSQRGAIDSAQSKALIENALRGWQQRWPNMADKPRNPAFTNFLMEVMGLQPLQ